jgi:hypothetical protein
VFLSSVVTGFCAALLFSPYASDHSYFIKPLLSISVACKENGWFITIEVSWPANTFAGGLTVTVTVDGCIDLQHWTINESYGTFAGLSYLILTTF